MRDQVETVASYVAAVDELVYSSPDSDDIRPSDITSKLQQQHLSPSLLEAAFRITFYRILATYDIDDPEFSAIWRLLDVVSVASDTELCEAGLPFLLIEELLDSQTIHGCRRVFDYLESRRERMTAKHWKAKHLTILRSCNELLRRLSRAEDTVFCGRVFIFLFQSFPLGDKSSVNLRGEYHTDNVTHYDQGAVTQHADVMEVDNEEMDKAGKPEAAPPSIKVEGKDAVDADALYPMFWALQEYFVQPTKLFDAENLESFKSGLRKTLLKFKEVYREEPRSGTRLMDDAQGKREADDRDGDNFNPRYLTSRDLFELEIRDPAFRRHILVQALIAVDFLLSQTPKAKGKLENLKNKSVIYDYALDDKDASELTVLRGDIAAYLQQGPEGKFYYRMVDTVLARDKNWLRWKAEGCPPFQLPPVTPDNYVEARESVQRVGAPRHIRKAPMGALDASFLEAKPADFDPLGRFEDPDRWKKPDLDGFRGAIMDAQFDLDMAQTDEDKLANQEAKSSAVWRALRVGGRFGTFDKLEDGGNLDPLFGIEPENGNDEEEVEAGAEHADTSLVKINVTNDDKDGDNAGEQPDGNESKADDSSGPAAMEVVDDAALAAPATTATAARDGEDQNRDAVEAEDTEKAKDAGETAATDGPQSARQQQARTSSTDDEEMGTEQVDLIGDRGANGSGENEE